MSKPLFIKHDSGLHLSITKAPNGYLLAAFNPANGRAANGFENTQEAAIGWIRGASLVLLDAEGRA